MIFVEAHYFKGADEMVVTTQWTPYFYYTTIVLLVGTMALTLGSCVEYLQRAVRLLRSDKEG